MSSSCCRSSREDCASRTWPFPLSELARLPYEPLKRLPVYHGAIKSLVTPEWHYIVHEKFGEELYHWDDDPQEQRNLVATPEGQQVAKDLAATLSSILAGKSGANVQPTGLGK